MNWTEEKSLLAFSNIEPTIFNYGASRKLNMEEYELHRRCDYIVYYCKNSLTPFCRQEVVRLGTMGRLQQLRECNIGNIDEFNRKYPKIAWGITAMLFTYYEKIGQNVVFRKDGNLCTVEQLFAIYKGLSRQRYLFQHNLSELYQFYKDSKNEVKLAEIDEDFRIWHIAEELELLEKSKKTALKLIPEFIIEYANNYVVSANCSTVETIILPKELGQENVRKYFVRAMSVGFIERTEMGYKWVYGSSRGQARLGYFCMKVFSNPRPINELEKLFGVTKLSSSITSACNNEGVRADVKSWRSELDSKIFFD